MTTNNAVDVGLKGATGTGNFVGSSSATITAPTVVTPATLGVQQAALDMNSHLINNVTDPVSTQDAATKHYVDQTALNGTSVYAATTTNLTVTQSGAGVGATLTNNGAQATFQLDGTTPPVGVNVLVKNLAAPQNEGIYTVTNAGSGASNWILTRATSFDTATEINNTGLILIQNGSTLVGTAWYNAATIVTVDTTAFSFSEFGNIVFPITLANGGTGAALTASNGGIFYSNASTGAIFAGTATAGLALLSGASTTPSWSSSPPITQLINSYITSTATYTPTTGMKYCFVRIVAGGGGSGGAAGAAGQFGASAGGGGGGYTEQTYTAAQIGANAAVVIGAGGLAGASGNNAGGTGGTSSFTPAGGGVTLSCTGGLGGSGSPSSATTTNCNGTTGGSGSGGFNITGGQSSGGYVFAGAAGLGIPGSGGGTPLGGPSFTYSPSTSASAQPYGSGASGVGSGGAANVPGMAGAVGVCYITEYISV